MGKSRSKSDTFRSEIRQASRDNSSRIVLAVDVQNGSSNLGFRQARTLLRKTTPYLCCVKLGRQTILNLGTRRTQQITRLVHARGLPCIIDDKLNDIGITNVDIAQAYFRLGFDALTANPFVGWKGGLQPLFQAAHKDEKGILLLVYMSHPGAPEGYGQKVMDGGSPRPQYMVFARKAVTWKTDGVVIGATWPKVVSEVKSMIGNSIPIFSPGVGTQGGDIKRALEAGTDYFIIGRSITQSKNPAKSAMRYAQQSIS